LKVRKRIDITLQTIWPATKFLVKRDGVETPAVGHGPWELKIQASDKTKEFAILSGKFSHHNLC